MIEHSPLITRGYGSTRYLIVTRGYGYTLYKVRREVIRLVSELTQSIDVISKLWRGHANRTYC